MKKINLVFACLLLYALSGCINDEAANCTTQFQLIFDYNILESNAINKQVDRVQLYLFNENKELTYLLEQEVNPDEKSCILYAENVLPGKYYAVGIGQSYRVEGKGHNFIVPNLTFETARLENLNARLPIEEGNTSSKEINNFLIGDAGLIHVDYSNSNLVHLKKVTNKIRIVLLDKDVQTNKEYELSLHEQEGNGWINYNFLSLPDKPITYYPYLHQYQELNHTDTGGDSSYSKAFVAAFSSSKLIATHPTILDIKEKNSQTVIAQVNILELLELGMIAEYSDKWEFQEYLDRRDDFVVSLFVENDTWLHAQVIINGWIISTDDIDL